MLCPPCQTFIPILIKSTVFFEYHQKATGKNEHTSNKRSDKNDTVFCPLFQELQ